METLSSTFMQLMCSKFCHDMAAPLGAMQMGLEMLQESPTDPTIQPLLQESTASAIARLEIFRCLTGYASTPNRPTAKELHKSLTSYLDKKIDLNWDLNGSEIPEGQPARLLLALILTASDTLIRGGTLTVHPQFRVSASSVGNSLLLRGEILTLLTQGAPLSQQSPKTIIPYYATILAHQLGGRIAVTTATSSQLQLQVVG